MEVVSFPIKCSYMRALFNCTCSRCLEAFTSPSTFNTCTGTNQFKLTKYNGTIKETGGNIVMTWIFPRTIPLCPVGKPHQSCRFCRVCTDIQTERCTLSWKYHRIQSLHSTHITVIKGSLNAKDEKMHVNSTNQEGRSSRPFCGPHTVN